MKKTLSILLALLTALSLFVCAFAEEAAPAEEAPAEEAAAEEAPAEEAAAGEADPAVVEEITALLEEMQFDPNPEYEEYTMVYYVIEDIQAELYCTISKKAVDDTTTEFYLECNFYGDDQMTVTTYDGTNFEITEDKTGFMAGDTPAILQIAIDNNVWFPIEAAAE